MITFIPRVRVHFLIWSIVFVFLMIFVRLLLSGPSVQAANEQADNRAVQQVVSFTLIDAHNDVAIGTLTNNYVVDCAAIGTLALNIRANTNPATVGSVVFGLDDNSTYRTENNQPYSIGGNTNGNYNAWKPVNGTHTVTATPYTLKNGAGTAGTPLSIQIIASACVEPTTTPTPTSTPVIATPTLTSTATVIPTETATDFPPTLTPTSESTGVPTETSVPATPTTTVTATSPAEIELITNGSFEVDTDGNKVPDEWTLKNVSRDKRICNKTNPPKQVAHDGECAFQFKGVPGERSKLLQFAALPGSLNPGDSVALTGFVQAKGAVNALVKLNVKYVDGFLPQGKLKLLINAPLSSFTAFSDLNDALSYTLVGIPNKIKLLLVNKGISGKVRFDGVSVMMIDSGVNGAAALLPLP